MKVNFEGAKKHVLKKSADTDSFISIKGYDFNEEFDFDRFLDSYKTTGFQASNMITAIDIIRRMI